MAENIFEAIGDASYNPKLNPVFGATRYTPEEYARVNGIKLDDARLKQVFGDNDSLWLTPQGHDVTTQVSALPSDQRDVMINTPYQSSGFFRKLFSPEAREVAGINRQYQVSPLIAAQQEKLRMVTPTYRNTQNEAIDFANSGGVGLSNADRIAQLRANTAQNNAFSNYQTVADLLGNPLDKATAEHMTLNSTMRQLNDDFAMHPNDFVNRQLGAQNTTQQLIGQSNALPALNASLYNRAKVDAGVSGQSLYDLPVTTGNMHLDAMRTNEALQQPQDFRTPEQKQTDNIRQMMGGTKMDVPGIGGVNYNPPTAAKPFYPVLGTGYSNLPIEADKYKGFSVDPTYGRILRDGVDVTDTLSPEATQAIRHDVKSKGMAQVEDAKQARHEADKQTIAAKMATLKAEQKALEAKHLSTDRLHEFGRGLANTAYDIGTGGQYMRDVGNATGKLISSGYNWLTGPQY